jgi:hypothetical protein
MPDHINATTLAIGLAILFAIRFIALLGFLLIMIKIQKFDFMWLPLIGAAFLASALDMIPLVGHFVAVPVLYLCVWKITNCELFPDATYTVAVSYALVRCLIFIMLAYAPGDFHPKALQNNNYDFASTAPPAAPSANETVQPDTPEDKANKTAAAISVKALSRGTSGTLVTIQYGSKIYTLSLGEGTTISTDEGLVTVRFVEAGQNDVTFDIDGQKKKCPLK